MVQIGGKVPYRTETEEVVHASQNETVVSRHLFLKVGANVQCRVDERGHELELLAEARDLQREAEAV